MIVVSSPDGLTDCGPHPHKSPVRAAFPCSVPFARARRRTVGGGRTSIDQSVTRQPLWPVMCGRFTDRLTWQQIHDLYRLTDPRQGQLDLKPRYNVAPRT